MSEKTTARDQRLAVGLCALILLLLVGGGVGTWIYGALRQRHAIEALTSAVPVPKPPPPPTPAMLASTCSLADIEAAMAFMTHGNSVRYGYQLGDDFEWIEGQPPGPAWLRDWLGIDFLATVRCASLNLFSEEAVRTLPEFSGLRSIELTDRDRPAQAVMEQLRKLPELESLGLYNLQLGDDQLGVLAELPRLRRLKIVCERIGDAELEQVSRIAGLEWLYLAGPDEATNAGLAKLSRLKNLKSLTISFYHRTSDAVLQQLSGLDRLEHLSIEYSRGGSGEAGGLKYLGDFASLKRLECYGITADGLSALVDAPKLKELSLLYGPYGHQLDAAGLRYLERLTNVEVLRLNGLPALDGAAMAQVARMPKLGQLVIQGGTVNLTDAGLESLSRAPRLRVLLLGSCSDLTDDGLTHLAKLKDLVRLDLSAFRPDQFSSEAIDALRKSLPKCDVQIHKP